MHFIRTLLPLQGAFVFVRMLSIRNRFDDFVKSVEYTQHFHKKQIEGYDQASVEYFPTCSTLFPTSTLLYFCDIFLTLLIFNGLSF